MCTCFVRLLSLRTCAPVSAFSSDPQLPAICTPVERSEDTLTLHHTFCTLSTQHHHDNISRTTPTSAALSWCGPFSALQSKTFLINQTIEEHRLNRGQVCAFTVSRWPLLVPNWVVTLIDLGQQRGTHAQDSFIASFSLSVWDKQAFGPRSSNPKCDNDRSRQITQQTQQFLACQAICLRFVHCHQEGPSSFVDDFCQGGWKPETFHRVNSFCENGRTVSKFYSYSSSVEGDFEFECLRQ